MLHLSSLAAAAVALLGVTAQASPILDSRQVIYGWYVLDNTSSVVIWLINQTHSYFTGDDISNYYISVGHDETVNGHELDCGTTSTAFNGQVFAKCTVDGATPTVTQRDAT